MKNLVLLLLTVTVFFGCKSDNKELAMLTQNEIKATSEITIQDNLKITPISHATMVLDWNGTIIYIDPVGGASAFTGQPEPDLILITDIHGDHLHPETLTAVISAKTKIVSPEAVDDELRGMFDGQRKTLYNGDIYDFKGLKIEAVPMYNLREEALKFHQKGRGNGYVLEKDGKRVYISGDTEDIPEMRALENIDVAFVCMNLPYTMTVESAASAVAEFKPKKVYPYHYRGTEGLSDVKMFKDLIKKSAAGNAVEVVQLDWYPKK
jgi:L-ascorbate metabolism protein UlaG (beta-lactamase superfamily)